MYFGDEEAGLVVDTHFARVSKRIGWCRTAASKPGAKANSRSTGKPKPKATGMAVGAKLKGVTPDAVRQDLEAWLPRHLWAGAGQ